MQTKFKHLGAGIVRVITLVRAFVHLYADGYRKGSLPCRHCLFVADKVDGKFFPQWITCNHCDWGNE